MNIPEEFDSIRPFQPEELPEVYDRLLSNSQFCAVLKHILPNVPIEAVAQKMRACKTSLDFQRAFCYEFLQRLIKEKSKGCDIDATNVDNTQRYTFISNHRDIVLDSALLDKLLIDAGFSTTCEIAIGDNLLSLPWVKDLVRLNKSFIVERNLPIRQMLSASKRLSNYMHFAVKEKKENVWIAQREGRAKDSNDRTQESVLKMMAMGGSGTAIQRLQQLHIVPLSISYEYDPCDYLKAKEFQLKRDIDGWHKSSQDDVESMRTGIMGYKGHIHYEMAPCIDDFLAALPDDTPKTELYTRIAEHIDTQIHRRYRLYPGNYIALDMLENTANHADKYTEKERQSFADYVESRIDLVDLPDKDEPFLRERLLTMYANPARNFIAATTKKL